MGEGQDKVTLSLPGDQDNLIAAIAQANPRTVVVLHNSNPVAMPWLGKSDGIYIQVATPIPTPTPIPIFKT